MRPSLRSLIIGGMLLPAAFATAWVDAGHMVIAAIARHEMTPKTIEEADRLLKLGGTERTATFTNAACWADDVRRDRPESAPWHYMDFHFRDGGAKTDNVPDKENAASAIEKFTKILADKSKPDAERGEALRFIMHFVGDIHQPLHGTARDSNEHPKGDRGGNDFVIEPPSLFRSRPPRNLHALWDLGGGLFTEEARPTDERGDRRIEAQAYSLAAALPRNVFKTVGVADPVAWAKESFEASKRFVYDTKEKTVPTDAYMARCRSVSAQRATLAGYRLADLLNRILG